MAGRLIKQSIAIASEGAVGKVNSQSNSIIEAVQYVNVPQISQMSSLSPLFADSTFNFPNTFGP